MTLEDGFSDSKPAADPTSETSEETTQVLRAKADAEKIPLHPITETGETTLEVERDDDHNRVELAHPKANDAADGVELPCPETNNDAAGHDTNGGAGGEFPSPKIVEVSSPGRGETRSV